MSLPLDSSQANTDRHHQRLQTSHHHEVWVYSESEVNIRVDAILCKREMNWGKEASVQVEHHLIWLIDMILLLSQICIAHTEARKETGETGGNQLNKG